MKKSLITAFLLSMVGMANAADTAKLYASNLGNGITNASGAAVASGTVRFGFFPAGFDFAANANNFTALDTAFVQVASYSGNLNAQSTNGFFDVTQTFATNGAFETVNYDSSAGVTTNVAGDVAGEKIYVWVLNNTTAASATEQAIFSINQTWPDKDELFTDVTASIDSGAAGLTAHLGALAAGPNIGAGVASHSMANPLGSAIATRTAPATSGTTVLRNTVVTFSVSITGTGPFSYRWRKDGVEVGGSGTTLNSNLTTNTYSIGTAELDEDGEYDCVVTNGLGSVTSNAIELDVFTTAPVVTLDALPQTLNVGDALNLSVDAEGQATLKYQWSLNGKPIANANTKNFALAAVALKDGGTYTCTVSNGTTAKDTSSADVVVVDNTPKTLVLASGATASTTLKVSVGGTPLSYEWYKDNVLLADQTTASLLIKPLVAAPVASVYKCVVTGVAGPKDGATTTLKIFDTAPDFAFTTPGVPAMPDGIVSGSYSYQILVDSAANKTPTGYDATGLPAGLTINKVTGLISGKPTKAGTNIKITLKISNSKGPAKTIQDTIDIAAFPAGIAGTYVGPVERIAKLGADLGGRLDNLIVAPTGVITGKLILGAVSYPLVGAVNVAGLNPLTATVSASLSVKRTGTLPALTLSFDLAGNLLTNGNITDGNDDVYVEGWRNIWAATPVGSNATAYVGRYNIALDLDNPADAGVASLPQGVSFASFTVAKDGKLTFTGKLSDGEAVTGSTFVGATGQVFLFQTMYKTVLKGSLLGRFVIDSKANADPADNTIAGDADWNRPENLAVANKLYRPGFAPLSLAVAGGLYVPPVGTTLLLDLTNGTDNAELSFESGGVEALVPNVANLTVPVSVKTGNKLTVGTNTVSAKIATAVPATGAIGGTFTVVPNKPTTYQGLIVPILGVETGVGYFIQDQPSTTPAIQLSGAVYFEKP